MTTIAYRDGIMAADSLVTGNGVVEGQFRKIADIKGFLVGGCGEISKVAAFFDWFRVNQPLKPPLKSHPFAVFPDYIKPKKDEEKYTILLVDKQNRQIWESDNGGYPYRLEVPFIAIGSGREIAVGAMSMSASAIQAVRASIKHDIYSGGNVQTKKCFPEKSVINPLKDR